MQSKKFHPIHDQLDNLSKDKIKFLTKKFVPNAICNDHKNRKHSLVSSRIFSGPSRAGPFFHLKNPARAGPGQITLSKISARAKAGHKKIGPGQNGPTFFVGYEPKRANFFCWIQAKTGQII